QGYQEGQNVAVEVRHPTTTDERLSHIAAGIVGMKPDVIFAAASSGIDAARNATTSIPIVALDLETDPLASGIVSSLARPGGKVPGLCGDSRGRGGKGLDVVRERARKVSRGPILWDPATGRVPLKGAEAAAPSLRLKLEVLQARGPSEFEAAFQAAIRGRAGA